MLLSDDDKERFQKESHAIALAWAKEHLNDPNANRHLPIRHKPRSYDTLAKDSFMNACLKEFLDEQKVRKVVLLLRHQEGEGEAANDSETIGTSN
jgi:hypothetical protein